MEQDQTMDNEPTTQDPPVEKSPSETIKISDRERMAKTGSPLAIDKTQIRKRVVAKHNIPQTKQIMMDSPKQQHNENMDVESVPHPKQMLLSPQITKSNNNSTKPSWKNYCCDKCKVCDEFETKHPKGTICDNCGCELIFHLRDGEESPVEDEEDAYEWQDEDSEDEDQDEYEDDD